MPNPIVRAELYGKFKELKDKMAANNLLPNAIKGGTWQFFDKEAKEVFEAIVALNPGANGKELRVSDLARTEVQYAKFSAMADIMIARNQCALQLQHLQREAESFAPKTRSQKDIDGLKVINKKISALQAVNGALDPALAQVRRANSTSEVKQSKINAADKINNAIKDNKDIGKLRGFFEKILTLLGVKSATQEAVDAAKMSVGVRALGE